MANAQSLKPPKRLCSSSNHKNNCEDYNSEQTVLKIHEIVHLVNFKLKGITRIKKYFRTFLEYIVVFLS